MKSHVPWTQLPIQDQLCVVVYDFSDDKRPFIPLIKLDLMICLQSYNNEWYRGYSLRGGPNHTGIFPANRVRRLQLPDSTDRAKYIYWSIWMKILWTKFLERFTSEPPSTYSDSMEKFNNALRGIHLGSEDGLMELSSYLNCKVPPFVDGLCNDWKTMSFTELKTLINERKNGLKELTKNSRVLSLKVKSLVMGYEIKQGVKGALLVYLFDEGKCSQLSETCKISFTTDKLGRIPKLAPLLFKDLKQASVRPTVFLSFRVLLEVPINEQKKTTTPIYKLAYWGCFKISEEVKRMTSQLSLSSNLTLISFNSGDKVNFSSKRYSRNCHLSKQQFLSYKICWISQEDENQSSMISLTNIGEILRTPPLVESKLYLTLQSGWFEKGKKKSEKNIEVLVTVVNEKDEVINKTIHEGCEKQSRYRSSVTRHCNTPQWNEMITIAMPDSKFKQCFVKFECTHVTSSELSHKTSLKWITYLPLSTQVGNVIPNSNYGLKLLPKNTYISKDLWEDDVLIKDENAQASKYVQRLIVMTHLDSTTLTDSAAICRIKSWNMHSKDLNIILEGLNRTDFSKCVDHCQQIFTSILEIIDSCADGEIVARAMTVLFSFNKFWNTNDDFKGRLLDSLDRLTFVSGLLKFVSWIKLVIKHHKSTQFNQTIKSLSLLLTIMSKSFVKIKRTRIMADAEIDRYKVVLANMLVDISHTEVGTNVMLCSQIIKVFPESLRVLYHDGIITNNEFSFHMISIMKGSILASLKDSPTNKISYIDHLQCIVNSDFMTNKDLQMRYFHDLCNGLTIQETFAPSDIEKMASIVVKLSDIAIGVITEQPMFSKSIIDLLRAYIQNLASNPDSVRSVEARLTFLSLIAALFEVLLAPNGTLSKEAFGYFENIVKLARRVVKIRNNTEDKTMSLASKQIDNAILCKKLSLASKILSYCRVIEKIDLISDMTFVAATLLAVPVSRIDHDNASNIILASRIHILQKDLHKLVEKNLCHLCQSGHFENALLDPIVAVGTLESNMEWLINFIDRFLDTFPDRLQEILLSIHVHKNNLTRNDYYMFEEALTLSQIVKEQMKLLQSLTSITEKSHTFDIEHVENLVSLINFYSTHQCWAPFKETAKVYQNLLIKSNAFLEAAELTEYCCALMPKEMTAEEEEELFTAASYYTEAGLWFRALEVFKKLQYKYENMKTKEAFIKLSEISDRCKELYINLSEKPNIPFHYFLVGFYGKEVNLSFQNKLFIFRGKPLESIIDFTKRITQNFPQYEHINSAKIPNSDEIAQYIKAFQVIKVNPIVEQSEFKEHNMKFKSFSFELCSVKDKTIQNELLRMTYQRFKFEINTPLPSFTPFCELSSMKSVKISPIEMAIEQIKKKSDELLQEAQKFATGEGNINQFQMMLNGTIDAAVNGGTAKLQHTFLDGDFAERTPNISHLCDVLKNEIDKQKHVVTECLQVHDKVCPADLRMLHEKMVHQHEDKVFHDRTSIAEESLEDHGQLATPQRHALLSEIARRGSKLKKSTKMNRVKSVFFESQARRSTVALEQEKNDTIDSIIETPPVRDIIDAKEFEKTYALLCTELNHDFNLHMLPRYSLGRRETMSKPLKMDKRLSNIEKVVSNRANRLNQNDAALRYSSRKELETYVKEAIVVDNFEVPDLPPKSKHSKMHQSASKNQKQTSDIEEIQENSLQSVPMSFGNQDISTSDQLTVHTSPVSTCANEDVIPSSREEMPGIAKRSYTIEKSCNIKPPTFKSSDPGHPEDSKVATTDALQLDLRSLATSFSLSSEDSQAKRKISKDDFDTKIKRNLSLNELKKTESDKY